LRSTRPHRVWLALSTSDGCRVNAGALRHRAPARSAERVELLRALRGSLSHADPAAVADAQMARARLCAWRSALGSPPCLASVGVRRHASSTLSRGQCSIGEAALNPCRGSRTTERASPRARLDGHARPSRTGGQDLPCAPPRADKERPTMSTGDQARAAILSRIRGALEVTGRERTRETAVEDRLSRHPRGTIPVRALGDRAALLQMMTAMLESQG